MSDSTAPPLSNDRAIPVTTRTCHGVTEAKEVTCNICETVLPSKSKLYKHLERDHGYISDRPVPIRIALTVGWISQVNEDMDDYLVDSTQNSGGVEHMIDVVGDEENEVGRTKRDVERSLFDAIVNVFGAHIMDHSSLNTTTNRPRALTRSSQLERSTVPIGIERTSHSLADVFCFQLEHPLGRNENAWVQELNKALPPHIHIMSCRVLPGKGNTFNATLSCSQRKYEYMIPISALLPTTEEEWDSLPLHYIAEKEYRTDYPTWRIESKMDQEFPLTSEEGMKRISFLRLLKYVMKKFNGRHLMLHNFVSGGCCPYDCSTIRQIDRFYHKEIVRDAEDRQWAVFSVSGDQFLRGQIRRMVGVAVAIARGWLPLEYLDLVLHPLPPRPYKPPAPHKDKRKTRKESSGEGKGKTKEEVDSTEVEVVMKSEIDGAKDEAKETEDEAKDEMKDGGENEVMQEVEKRLELIWDLPSVPGAGLMFSEASYANYEAKYCDIKLFIDPRRQKEPVTEDVLQECERISTWRQCIRDHVMQSDAMKCLLDGSWARKTQITCNRIRSSLAKVKRITERPKDYLEAVFSSTFYQNISVFNQSSHDTTPAAYRNVLRLLQEADRSGSWPKNSRARQTLINQTTPSDNGGTFSIGSFPSHLPVPKGNDLFPELLEACFELERIILPHRKPSTTIAVNRNAQFKVHRDTGAGNGQSSSAIVALGDFTGGELGVEYDVHDIRYRPIEFDGWRERHYTLPFVGERYSLVWFTPCGM